MECNYLLLFCLVVPLKFLPFMEECVPELDNEEHTRICAQVGAGSRKLDKPAQ